MNDSSLNDMPEKTYYPIRETKLVVYNEEITHTIEAALDYPCCFDVTREEQSEDKALIIGIRFPARIKETGEKLEVGVSFGISVKELFLLGQGTAIPIRWVGKSSSKECSGEENESNQ